MALIMNLFHRSLTLTQARAGQNLPPLLPPVRPKLNLSFLSSRIDPKIIIFYLSAVTIFFIALAIMIFVIFRSDSHEPEETSLYFSAKRDLLSRIGTEIGSRIGMGSGETILAVFGEYPYRAPGLEDELRQSLRFKPRNKLLSRAPFLNALNRLRDGGKWKREEKMENEWTANIEREGRGGDSEQGAGRTTKQATKVRFDLIVEKKEDEKTPVGGESRREAGEIVGGYGYGTHVRVRELKQEAVVEQEFVRGYHGLVWTPEELKSKVRPSRRR